MNVNQAYFFQTAFLGSELDEKRYGLSEIKETIVEYLAAQQKAVRSNLHSLSAHCHCTTIT